MMNSKVQTCFNVIFAMVVTAEKHDGIITSEWWSNPRSDNVYGITIDNCRFRGTRTSVADLNILAHTSQVCRGTLMKRSLIIDDNVGVIVFRLVCFYVCITYLSLQDRYSLPLDSRFEH